jgi:hypothetical protein
MDFIIAIILGLANGRRAADKGYSRMLWTFLSVLAFVVLESFAGVLMMLVLYRDELRENPLRMVDAVKDFASNMDWTRSLLLLAIGFGGYLLVRFILEKMPPNRAGNANPKG